MTNDSDKRADPNTSTGLAILCDANGAIREIIANQLDLQATAGKPFTSILAPSSLRAGLDFLVDVRKTLAIFGRQLEVNINGTARPMQFAGGLTDEGILIIGALSGRDFERFYSDLTKINNEQATLLRQLMKQQESDTRSGDAAIYEDFSRLNNELSTLQRELTRKNVQLERLNEQKNQLLGMAAHDLRNPLGVIMSYAKFLQHMTKDKLDDKELQFVKQIERSSQFMLRMLEDLLDISQIESGKLELKLEPTNVMQLLKDNIQLNNLLAKQKDISVELEVIQPAPSLMIDPGKIEQVLNNLISNAMKYSHPGTAARVVVDRQPGHVLVQVIDQGQGIPGDELDRLFKPFSKTSVKSTGGEKSTGLGLVITKKIIEGHGGQIAVESKTLVGSTFSFTLPISDGQAPLA